MSQPQLTHTVYNPYRDVSNSDSEWPEHVFDPNDYRVIGIRAHLAAASDRVEVGVYYAAKDRLDATRREIEAARRLRWKGRLEQIKAKVGDIKRAFHGRSWMT